MKSVIPEEKETIIKHSQGLEIALYLKNMRIYDP